MATIKRFEDLEIWQLARELANEIFETYTTSESFSKDYKLKDQINDSSGSIIDNISEGFERRGRNEFINFLTIAKGSNGEVKSQLEQLYDKAEHIGKKIGAFINYLNSSSFKGNKFKNRKDL